MQRAAFVGADAGLFAGIGERSIAVVVIQAVGVRGVVERPGVIVGSVEIAILGIEFYVSSDEQIDAAVAIVVKPRGAYGPALHLNSSLCAHVRKGPIAIVAIENRFPVAGHEQIDESVIVVVRRDRSRAKYICGHASLLSDVSESSVSIIAIQVMVGRSGRKLLQRIWMDSLVQRLAACDVEIRESVIVEIEPDAAGTRALQQRSQFLRPETVGELDP